MAHIIPSILALGLVSTSVAAGTVDFRDFGPRHGKPAFCERPIKDFVGNKPMPGSDADGDGILFSVAGTFKHHTFTMSNFSVDTDGSLQLLMEDTGTQSELDKFRVKIKQLGGPLHEDFRSAGEYTFDLDPGRYKIHVWAFADNPRSYGSYAVELSSLTASPVPVPAAAWLFGSGLAGLLAVTRRGRRHTAGC